MYRPNPRLQALLAARPGVRNLTKERQINFLAERYTLVTSSAPEWETVELHLPVRDENGRFKRDEGGLIVTELRRISKRAQLAVPILEQIEAIEQSYIDFLESYVDPATNKIQCKTVAERLKSEGYPSGNDPDTAARAKELMAEHEARNRETVAKMLASAAPAAPAPASSGKGRGKAAA